MDSGGARDRLFISQRWISPCICAMLLRWVTEGAKRDMPTEGVGSFFRTHRSLVLVRSSPPSSSLSLLSSSCHRVAIVVVVVIVVVIDDGASVACVLIVSVATFTSSFRSW